MFKIIPFFMWIVWRYQRGNQNPYIEEEQSTQWPKEKKVHKDNDRLYVRVDFLLTYGRHLQDR